MSTQADETRPGVLGRLQIRHLYPLIALALLPLAAAGPIGDNSFLWHVRAGSAQWDLGKVLSSDVFSYTMAGASWRTQSWLAELGYAGLEGATGGVGWAAVLVTIVCLTALALIGLSVYGATKSTVSIAIWLFIAVWLFAPFANPRPVIFSYLLLAALVLIIRLDRLLWAAVPLIWIWGALHGSWLIGLGLLVLEAIRRRSWKVASLAGLSVVAVSLTAHGLGVWLILRDFMANRDALEFLVEWGRPDFLDIVQGPYLLIVAAVVVAFIRSRIRLNELWIVLPFLLAGFTTQRTVVLAAIVLLPYAALAFDVKVPATSRRRGGPAWVVALLVVAVGVVALFRPADTFNEERFPSDELMASVESDRFFHDDAVGGYLIYRDWPHNRVYIDDRAELYGAEFFQGLRDAKAGDYEELFAQYDMTEALVKPEWGLAEQLARDGWETLAEDEFFAVMRAPAG